MREIERRFWLAVLWLASFAYGEGGFWMYRAKARLAEIEAERP